MAAFPVFALALLLQAPPPGEATTVSVRTGELRRIPVTAEHLATAFANERARSLLLRARDARVRQDSAITSYDATAYQRASIGMSFKAVARNRLFMRHEAVTRVRWQRHAGAVVDVLGSRFVLPSVLGDKVDVDDTEVPGIPYYPGRDDFWFGLPASLAESEEVMFIHPIAAGAEAYYRYHAGDSVLFDLPGGDQVRLYELRIRPREPSWRLAVGSLWFDAESAQLVRAVYRLAAPIDAQFMLSHGDIEGADPIVARTMRALLSPLRGTLQSLVVEHGLYEGRFWLPRTQTLEGDLQVSFARIPIRVEERFDYASVNGRMDSLPPIPRSSEAARDSIRADSLGLTGTERRDWMNARVQERIDAYKRACDDPAGVRTRSHSFHDGHLPAIVRMPCDTVALKSSPELPASIYDENEAMLSADDLEKVQRMIGLGAQAGFDPQRPELYYGPGHGLLRYNRIEGLSGGAGVRAELGAGLAFDARAQIGLADQEPNGELGISRSDGERTLRIAGYRRLAVANDWGTPLSFGASLNSFLFGLDEGFYHRALGAELAGSAVRDARFEWRFFAERHERAERETHFSLANALHGLGFDDNIMADEGTLFGAAARLTRTWGADPRGFSLFGDLRLESATGDFDFGRGALDLTLSRPFLGLAGSITAGAGATVGDVPVQRMYFLGGTQTVRGQQAGTMIGDAYWLARAELGTAFPGVRPTLFYDLGWAGDRDAWRHPGRPMSGAGVGLSMLGGLVRLDVARGIHPRPRWTMGLSLDARF